LEGVIVAEIPLSTYVSDRLTSSSGQDEWRANSSMQLSTRKPYQAIFCSYSHSDEQVARRVEQVCKALGMDYLRDVNSLRSGQLWSDELAVMIKRADIFQLFWSEHAASSKYVTEEWQYALGLGREQPAFIRPVFWQHPMPQTPKELSRIHFAYVPEFQDSSEQS
jgi:hypothetical protein